MEVFKIEIVSSFGLGQKQIICSDTPMMGLWGVEVTVRKQAITRQRRRKLYDKCSSLG